MEASRYEQTMDALNKGIGDIDEIDTVASIETDVLSYLYEWYPPDQAEAIFGEWHRKYASGLED